MSDGPPYHDQPGMDRSYAGMTHASQCFQRGQVHPTRLGMAWRARRNCLPLFALFTYFLSFQQHQQLLFDCALAVQVHGVHYILDSKVRRDAPFVPPQVGQLLLQRHLPSQAFNMLYSYFEGLLCAFSPSVEGPCLVTALAKPSLCCGCRRYEQGRGKQSCWWRSHGER